MDAYRFTNAYRQIIPYSKNKRAFFTFFFSFCFKIDFVSKTLEWREVLRFELLSNVSFHSMENATLIWNVLWVLSSIKYYQNIFMVNPTMNLHIFASKRSFFVGISPRDAQIAYKWLIWFDVNANRLDKIANLLFRSIYKIAINGHLAMQYKV